MNIKLYHKIIENPTLLNSATLEDVADLVKNYPMVENFRILYALNLLIQDDYRYEKALTKAAIYSSDRRKLKKWIDFMLDQNKDEEIFPDLQADEPLEIEEENKDVSSDHIDEEPKETPLPQTNTLLISKPQVEEEKQEEKSIGQDSDESENKADLIIPISQTKEILKEESIEENLEAEKQNIRTKKELLQLVQKRLNEIEQEKQVEKEESKETSNIQLIDQFIANEPSISRPDKNEFFDPQNEAIESSVDEDDFFVTETLAQIHTQQGNDKKAIEIYRKLILKNPEKSAYFAAQIEKLTKK